MRWRETEYEDLHRIELPADPLEGDMRSMPDTPEYRTFLREHARTWVDDDGLLLAVVGITPQWKGVGTVWTLLHRKAHEKGVSLTRGVLRCIDMLHRERGYWRLQATVEHGGHVAGELWMMQLGFEREGTMIAYGPDGKTHDLYARVRVLV